MEKYGEFIDSINKLDSVLSTVQRVWTDQTARTYATINENMKEFVSKISSYLDYSVEVYELVKKYYRESEIDEELNVLSTRVASV